MELTGKVTKYVNTNPRREIRILAEERVRLHPEHVKRNPNGSVRMVVVSPKRGIPHAKPLMLPIGFISMNQETRQYMATL